MDSKKCYAVFRNGLRVSGSEYDSESAAQKELKYWQEIVKRYPDGSVVEIKLTERLNQESV